MQMESLKELFVKELCDIYDAEQQILKALPKMAKAATTQDLRRAFETHKRQTEGQVERLDRVFEMLDMEPKKISCKGMKGLIAEGNELMKEKGDDTTIDAGLIGAAQKVEHYEIAAYGTVRTFATQLGETDIAQLLEQTLNEEKQTDAKLTQIAESSVNQEAAANA